MAKANFDREKWLKEKNEKLDGMESQIKDIVNSFKMNPEHIVELLEFKSQFYSYSFKNCMLISKHNSHVSFVASFKEWQDKGYNVKRGEKGLPIFYPAFAIKFINEQGNEKFLKEATEKEKLLIKSGKLKKDKKLSHFDIGYVFDIAQTDCPVEAYPKIYSMGSNSFTHKEHYENLKGFIESKGVKVEDRDLKSITLRGQAFVFKDVIYSNEKLKDTEKLSTFTHEVGHNSLHKGDIHTPTSIKEFEADCLSIMLQKKFNVEITDSRKKHLKEHFFCLPNDYDIIKSFNRVSETYNTVSADLDKFIEQKKVVQLEQPSEVMKCIKDIECNCKEAFDGGYSSIQDYHNNLIKTYGTDVVINAIEKVDNKNLSDPQLQSLKIATEQQQLSNKKTIKISI